MCTAIYNKSSREATLLFTHFFSSNLKEKATCDLDIEAAFIFHFSRFTTSIKLKIKSKT